jgi:chromosomal replication initiation ATPase DnaA
MQIVINDHSAAPIQVNIEKRDPLRLTKLLRAIASKHGASLDEIQSRSTSRQLASARGEFCYLAFTELDAPIIRIARAMKRVHHEAVRISIALHCANSGLPYPPGFSGDYWLYRRNNQIARRRKVA